MEKSCGRMAELVIASAWKVDSNYLERRFESFFFRLVNVAQWLELPVCGTGGREFESHDSPYLGVI